MLRSSQIPSLSSDDPSLRTQAHARRQWTKCISQQNDFIHVLHPPSQRSYCAHPHTPRPKSPPPNPTHPHPLLALVILSFLPTPMAARMVAGTWRSPRLPWGLPSWTGLEGWPTIPYWLQCRFLLLRVTHGSHLLLLGWEGSTSPRARVCLPEPRRSALGLARSSAAARPPHRARFLDLAASRGPELRPILWGKGAWEAFWALCPAVQTRPEAGTGLCGSPQGSRLW